MSRPYTGWLVSVDLFRQNQFSVPSDSQAVFFCLMDDHDLPLTLKEMSAFNPRLFVLGAIAAPVVPDCSESKITGFSSIFLFNGVLHRQEHPYLHRFLYPARRFKQPFFHCLSGREIKLMKPADFSMSTSPTCPFSSTLTLSKVTPWAPIFARRFRIAGLNLIAAKRPGRRSRQCRRRRSRPRFAPA